MTAYELALRTLVHLTGSRMRSTRRWTELPRIDVKSGRRRSRPRRILRSPSQGSRTACCGRWGRARRHALRSPFQRRVGLQVSAFATSTAQPTSILKPMRVGATRSLTSTGFDFLGRAAAAFSGRLRRARRHALPGLIEHRRIPSPSGCQFSDEIGKLRPHERCLAGSESMFAGVRPHDAVNCRHRTCPSLWR